MFGASNFGTGYESNDLSTSNYYRVPKAVFGLGLVVSYTYAELASTVGPQIELGT